jgi:hypothetical protein
MAFLMGITGDAPPQQDFTCTDGLGKTFSRPSRDEFSSKAGSYIKLGNHKSNAAEPTIRAYDATFISHSPIKSSMQRTNMNPEGRLVVDSSSNSEYSYTGGLHTTKFHSGFQRKGEKYISNPAADEIRAIAEAGQGRKDNANTNRAAVLYQTNNKNGFNVITGAAKVGLTPVSEKKGGKRCIRPTVSNEVAANSRIILRESEGRFYMPHATGVKHEYRQDILNKGGIQRELYSYVLQPGKQDLKSTGIEDNFSRSQYPGCQSTNPNYMRNDLPMMREAGKYTPRKQVGNPSGNPALIKSWGSGLDINDKALRGIP